MKLRELSISNFRSLESVGFPLDETTVFIGENNSGKTAILDALRLVLSPGSRRNRAVFSEYDYRLAEPEDSPHSAKPIEILFHFQEEKPHDWPPAIARKLPGIPQLDDPNAAVNSIRLRVSSGFDRRLKQHVTTWAFLNAKGQVLKQEELVDQFLLLVPAFYLSALRDSAKAFSPDSELWGRLVRSLDLDHLPPELRQAIDGLNQDLLATDPRLTQIRQYLQNLQDVLPIAANQSVSIRALPQQPWELLSRADITVRASDNSPDFPLGNHGQGTQSLAVLFLFQAFVDILLKETFEPESEAILALEEPEAHLHPQPIRSLWQTVSNLPGQKLISTHSPYFVQDVPLRSLRRVRREGSTTRVHFIKEQFTCSNVPNIPSVVDFCRRQPGVAVYHEASQVLSLKKTLRQDALHDLIKDVDATTPEGQQLIDRLTLLQLESTGYLAASEIQSLEKVFKRMRGEVLFARAWLLCEGQSEYYMISYLAEVLGTPLDPAGVSIIDFQNNGTCDSYVALAQALGVPWVFVSDGDAAGNGFKQKVADRGIDPAIMAVRALQYAGDFESVLAASFADEVVELMRERGTAVPEDPGTEAYNSRADRWLTNGKVERTMLLVEKLRQHNIPAARVPQIFRTLIEEVIRLAHA